MNQLFERGQFGYATHQMVDGVLTLTSYNSYLVKTFGDDVVQYLQNPIKDKYLNHIMYDHQWLRMYHDVVNDHKIRVFTNIFNDPNQWFRFLVIPTSIDEVTTIIISLPISHNDTWVKEALYQKIVTNIIDAVQILNIDLNFIVAASSNRDYFKEDRNRDPVAFIDSQLKSKPSEIQKKIKTFLAGEGSIFLKFESDEYISDGQKLTIRSFLTRLIDENGQPIGVVGLTKNITSRLENLKHLQSEHNMLEAILHSTAEGIYGIDLQGECTFCNESCLNLLGYQFQEELIGHNMHALIHHHNAAGDVSYYHQSHTHHLLTTGNPLTRVETTIWRKDGTSFIGECYGYPQRDNGVIVGAIMTFYDITKIKSAIANLEESERSKSILLQNIPGMAYRCRFDHQWTMTFVSEGIVELLGYQPEEMLYNRDVTFNDVIDAEFQDYLWKRWNEVLPNHKKFREEYRIHTKDGQEKWVLELGQGIYGEASDVIAIEGIVIDITEQKRRQHEAEFLNIHDQLTGLYNRIYFDSMVEQLDQPKYYPLTYMMGDINGLKLVNDAYGHEYGNQHILKVVEIIKQNFQKQEVVARIGGDEFGILLPNTSKETAYLVLKNLQERLKKYNLDKDAYVPELSVSFGFETKNDSSLPFLTIAKNAEDYMNRRKLLERNSSHSSILNSIKTTMFERSQETEEHAERMAFLTHNLGIKFHLTQLQLDLLSLFASLHDIGKVGISDQILKKPGPLTIEEWDEMKKHPEIGYRICLSSPELTAISEFVLSHHERWDGTGYPRGLKHDDIPILSRILAIVDAYDSMTNDRIYRKALSKQVALEEIKDKAGTQFDPVIAEAFIIMMEK